MKKIHALQVFVVNIFMFISSSEKLMLIGVNGISEYLHLIPFASNVTGGIVQMMDSHLVMSYSAILIQIHEDCQ